MDIKSTAMPSLMDRKLYLNTMGAISTGALVSKIEPKKTLQNMMNGLNEKPNWKQKDVKLFQQAVVNGNTSFESLKIPNQHLWDAFYCKMTRNSFYTACYFYTLYNFAVEF